MLSHTVVRGLRRERESTEDEDEDEKETDGYN